ncbi:trypco2 family protein [Streptomyces sp. NRRL F-5123]|uniref:trypco2 family protein n=1 Tax=Streptomyces sp. NRRL F-5123 TaxID=1463856 RepID=UPI0004E18025|nr:trypco2 family protein [Streptomyces sp. NRRL F-5123]
MEIELADAVAELRDELTRAVARGAGQDITFQVGPIELEFTVELRADARARAGFKAWVVSGDAEAGSGRTRTHRVRLTLQPQGRDGRPLPISGGRDAFFGADDFPGRIDD